MRKCVATKAGRRCIRPRVKRRTASVPGFVCSGESVIGFTVSEAGAAFVAETDTGFFTVRFGDGSTYQFPSGEQVVDLPVGTYCAWASDASGVVSGSFNVLGWGFGISALRLEGIAGTGPFVDFQVLYSPITSLSIPYVTGNTYIAADVCPIVDVDINPAVRCVAIYFTNAALSEASVVNVIEVAHASAVAGILQEVDLRQGTSASPPASVAGLIDDIVNIYGGIVNTN